MDADHTCPSSPACPPACSWWRAGIVPKWQASHQDHEVRAGPLHSLRVATWHQLQCRCWCQGGTTEFAQKDAIAPLLANLVTQYGDVKAPVQVSIDEIEAPLLSSPKGDVVTVLNHALLGNPAWTVHPNISNGSSTFDDNLPIELNVSLGYAPASVLSTQLGPLPHTVPAPGWVVVKLPTFHIADMIVFKR